MLLFRTLTFIFTIFFVGHAAAEDNRRQFVWFHSETSHLLNLSSIALANNHVKRGVRFAKKALESQLTEADKLIAMHNLCIAHLEFGALAPANTYCEHTIELAHLPFQVSIVRGTLRLQSGKQHQLEQPHISLIEAIETNFLIKRQIIFSEKSQSSMSGGGYS